MPRKKSNIAAAQSTASSGSSHLAKAPGHHSKESQPPLHYTNKSFSQQLLCQACLKQSSPRLRYAGRVQAPAPGWAGLSTALSHPALNAHGAQTHGTAARHHWDKLNPVINMECRSRLRGVIHNSYCTSSFHCARKDCLEVDSGNSRRWNKKEVSLTQLRTSFID